MRAHQLLMQSHRRLGASGLVIWGAIWSSVSLLLFYWPSRLLSAPWSIRLSAVKRIDLSVVRLLLTDAMQSGLLGWLILVFALRLLATPLVDAFIYQRLASPERGRFAPGGFYRLYFLVIMALALGGWLCYLGIELWLGMLTQPVLLALTLCLFSLILWLIGIWLSWQRAHLAGGQEEGKSWPPRLGIWLLLAQAQGTLTSCFFVLTTGLYLWAWSQQGVLLIALLLLLSVLRTYGRLWKLACVTEIWQMR